MSNLCRNCSQPEGDHSHIGSLCPQNYSLGQGTCFEPFPDETPKTVSEDQDSSFEKGLARLHETSTDNYFLAMQFGYKAALLGKSMKQATAELRKLLRLKVSA